MSVRRIFALALVGASACVSPAVPAPLEARAVAFTEPARCEGDELSERLVVDWSPLDRARLESATRRGLVALRVSGCTARVLEYCTVRRAYTYAPTSRQREVIFLRDHDELRARLPIGVARFGGALERASALSVTMTVVGRYEAPFERVSTSELEGDCEGATHVVASMAIGAFEIADASAASIAGEADVVAASASVERDVERRHVDSAGVDARCAEARRTDTEPPSDCAIPLRVEVRRLGAAPKLAPATAPDATPAPEEDVRKASAQIRREIAPCYRRALLQEPALDGALTLFVTVGAGGDVRSVSAKHDVPPSLADCAVRRASRVVFPRADRSELGGTARGPVPAAQAPRLFVLPVIFHGPSAGQ